MKLSSQLRLTEPGIAKGPCSLSLKPADTILEAGRLDQAWCCPGPNLESGLPIFQGTGVNLWAPLPEASSKP